MNKFLKNSTTDLPAAQGFDRRAHGGKTRRTQRFLTLSFRYPKFSGLMNKGNTAKDIFPIRLRVVAPFQPVPTKIEGYLIFSGG